MIRSIECTLVGDGSSDKMLIYPIRWLLRELFPTYAINIEFADLRGQISSRSPLEERINVALDLYPCNLLFIHRDSEGRPINEREAEIENAIRRSRHPDFSYVAVIPVRMTEAWFLHSEGAIRIAAGNPNGRAVLELPNARNLHEIADPKARLEELLRTATGLNRRRLRSFHPRKQMHRLAEIIEDYSVLRNQEAFQLVENQVKRFNVP